MNYFALKPKVIASIVLFNHTKESIYELILTLLNERCVERLILIDNGNCQWASQLQQERIIYIKSEQNRGFGAGHNSAFKKYIHFSGYFLICNPDISFESGQLDKLVDVTYQQRYAFTSPRIVYKDGQQQYSCRLLPTPHHLFFRRFIPLFAKKADTYYELRCANYKQSFNPPAVSGCFMLISNPLLQQLNGFDERYFMYLEDIDLCRRALDYTAIHYYPNVTITHLFNKGSYKNKRLLWYHIRSALSYFNKWGWFFDKKRRQYNKQAWLSIMPSLTYNTKQSHQE